MENKVLCCFNNICWLCVRLRKLMNALHHPQQNESWKSGYFRQTHWLDPEVHGNQMLYLYLWPVWQRNEKCQRENNKHSVWRNFCCIRGGECFHFIVSKVIEYSNYGAGTVTVLIKDSLFRSEKKMLKREENTRIVPMYFDILDLYYSFFLHSFSIGRHQSQERNGIPWVSSIIRNGNVVARPEVGKLSKATRIFLVNHLELFNIRTRKDLVSWAPRFSSKNYRLGRV